MIEISSWMNRDCTIGRLRYQDFVCFTLELPWRQNLPNKSCIPGGIYNASLYESHKFGTVVLLEGVPDRAMIEIHAGNYTRDIEGCILVGDSIKYLDSDSVPDVTNSKNTLMHLLAKLPDRFSVQIKRV